MANRGTLIGIGLGPGDSELVTLKAINCLKRLSVIYYPATSGGTSIARTIAEPYLQHRFDEFPILIPMSPDVTLAERAYDEATNHITEYLDAGTDVGVLCEGDPFFFGSFMYLFHRLVADYAVNIIPGISSMMACAAVAATPLGARNDVLTVIPAPLDNNRIGALLDASDTAVIMKLGRHFARVKTLLAANGLIDNCYYIERATLDNEIHMPLSTTGETAPYFSMILYQKDGAQWRR